MNAGPTLRPAAAGDVEAVVGLVQRAYRGERSRAGWTTEADLLDGQRTDAAAVAALVETPGSAVLLLERHGALVGCCHVEGRPPAQEQVAQERPGQEQVEQPAGGGAAEEAATAAGRGLAYVGMVAVDPRQQGAGTGRVLLAGAEAYARGVLGATRLEMTVIAQRTELVAWYERRGWRRTGERRPFPYGDERFGVPRRDDLEFVVLARGAG